MAAQNVKVIRVLDVVAFHVSTDVTVVRAGLHSPSSFRSL